MNKQRLILCFLIGAISLFGELAAPGFAQQSATPRADPALQRPQVILNPPSEYALAARKWQGIAGIARAANGRLWAAWYSGGSGEGPGNYVVLVTSADDGHTWSHTKLVISPPGGKAAYLREFDPCLWLDPTGKLWLFWSQSIPWFDGRAGVWAISTKLPSSASPQWSKPRRIADGVMLNKPIVAWRGRWLLPIAGWRNIKVRLSPSSVEASHLPLKSLIHNTSSFRGSNVFESTDGLASVHFVGQARVPDTWFDEQMLIKRRGGSLWMLVRTTYGIGQAVSTNRGKSWTSLENTGLSHVNSRFFVRRLNSGKLLLVSNLPPAGTSRSWMTARISSDDGRTWSKGLTLDSRNLVAYPDGVQSPNGTIYVIYDRDREGAGDILMAVFTEQDVLAGHIVSKQARLAQVVRTLHK